MTVEVREVLAVTEAAEGVEGAMEAGEVRTAVAARAKAVAVEAAMGVRAATVVPRST